MILAPVSKGHWEDFLIPAAYTNIRELINKEPRPNLPLVKLPYSTKRHGQQAHDEGSETGSSDQRLAGEFENNDTKEKDSRRNSVTDEHTMPADPTGIPENSSPASHISFVVHRNIEHILSVCSIPLKPARMRIDAQVTDEEIPVALTCGDLSFHRINVSSSL